jgi:methyl-accepting chemotaxis protein
MTNLVTSKLETKIIIVIGVVLSLVLFLMSSIYFFSQSAQSKHYFKKQAQNLSERIEFNANINSSYYSSSSESNGKADKTLMNLIHGFSLRTLPDSAQEANFKAQGFKIGDKPIDVKLTSPNFRNPINKPGSTEELILRDFEKLFAEMRLERKNEFKRIKPANFAYWDKVETSNNEVYSYVYPIFAKKACLTCHGERKDAPDYILSSYSSGFGYSEGDFMGAITIYINQAFVEEEMWSGFFLPLFLGLFITVLILVVVIFTLKKIVGEPIKKIVSSAKNVSQGDLTQKITYEPDDEIGDLVDSVNIMVDSVKESVRDITDLTLHLNQVSLEISDTATRVLKNAENQSLTVQEIIQIMDKMNNTANQIVEDMQGLTINVRETRSSIEDLSGTIQEAARNIQEANQVFSQVIHEVQEGRYSIEQVNLSMSSISDKLEGLLMQIHNFDRVTRDVTSIVEKIARTAKQTNLLAVNASIESAIAGEAGKGFKVVANEIRALAEAATSDSQQIKEMLFNVRQLTTKVQDAVVETGQSARDSKNNYKSAEKTLEHITTFYSRSSLIMSRLSNLIDTQMRSSQQITMKTSDMNIRTSQVVEQVEAQKQISDKVNKSISSLSDTALRNKEASQEISQLTQDLISQAEQLQNAIKRFRVSESPQVL